MGFSTFTELGDHHHLLIENVSITPKRNSVPLGSHSPFFPRPPHPNPCQPRSPSTSLDLPVLDIFHQWNHTVWPFCGRCFSQSSPVPLRVSLPCRRSVGGSRWLEDRQTLVDRALSQLTHISLALTSAPIRQHLATFRLSDNLVSSGSLFSL